MTLWTLQIKDRGGSVFHHVDATKLSGHFKVLCDAGQTRPVFDKIVFHFPHTGIYMLYVASLVVSLFWAHT